MRDDSRGIHPGAGPGARAAPSRFAGSTAICVLGPPRSGTSLTTRLLGLAGVYLGSEDDLLVEPAYDANPKGYWESQRVIDLNDRILAAFGGSWHEPPHLPAGWERSERLDAEREGARELFEGKFGDRGLWGWKDPRSSLTLPFWRHLLEPAGCALRCVVTLRNPLDMAASASAAGAGFPRGKLLEIWHRYVASALVNTADLPRMLNPYESYFDDWRATVENLVRFAGCEMPEPGTGSEGSMREFTDEGLWRHRTKSPRAMNAADIPPSVRSLHMTSRMLVADPAPDLAAAVEAHLRRLLDDPRGSDTESKLRSFIVAELLDDRPPGGGDPLAADEVDSLGLEQLVEYIEAEFGIAIDDEEIVLENFASVPALSRLVDFKRARAAFGASG